MKQGGSVPTLGKEPSQFQRSYPNDPYQLYGMDVEGLLADPGVRKFVDWVANKDADFTATMTKKQR